MTQSDIDRFFSKVRITPGCWIWTAGKFTQGYGNFWAGKVMKAHRVSYQIHFGELHDMHVLHSCDNPECVNPMHLRVGTHADNMRDKTLRGRSNRRSINAGESHGGSKISEQDVLEIKRRLRLGHLQKLIAIDFSLDPSTISHIKSGRLWKHLEIRQ